MKYLIVSDSHGMTEEMLNLFSKYPNYTKIHLGDFCIDNEILDNENVIYVKGNCDFYGEKEIILDTQNGKMLITHGDLYHVKRRIDTIYYKALECECKYILFGHTHTPVIDKINDIYFLNPGSLKDGTYIVLENGKPTLIEM